MSSARLSATVSLLRSGEVLIAGGIRADRQSVASADLFDPASGKFTSAAGTMSNARSAASAVTLRDGRIMIAGGSVVTLVGGEVSVVASDTVDFFDRKSDQFTAGVPMISPRDFFTATLLKSDKVLLPGGRAILVRGVGTAVLETAEIYTP